VTYSWSNVLQPINVDGSSIFKSGSTIPVKFRLTGASAACPTAVAKLLYAKVADGIAGTETFTAPANSNGQIALYIYENYASGIYMVTSISGSKVMATTSFDVP